MDHLANYARAVVSGECPSNKRIYAACKRSLEWIDNPPEGLIYLPDRWTRIYDWCASNLKVVTNQKAVPYQFHPWASFVLAHGECFRRADTDGNPTAVAFRCIGAEAARGSGKTVAMIAYLIWRIIHRDYQNIIVTAQGLQQLRDVWITQLHAMVRESPVVAEALHVSSLTSMNAKVLCEATSSVISFRATGTGKSLQGLNAGAVCCDELGETDKGKWLEAIEQGIQKDRNACLYSITTPPPAHLAAGPYSLRRTAWADAHEKGSTNTLFLPWGLDPEDPIEGGATDEERSKTWGKAYPPGFNQGLKTLDDYKERLAADTAQDTLADFELRQCCRFTTSTGNAWLPPEWLERATVEMTPEAYRGAVCWAGLDMSKSGDLTSLCAVCDVAGALVVSSWHFLPSYGKSSKFHLYGANLEGWKKLPNVHVSQTPLVDYDAIQGRLHWLNNHVDLQVVKYDDWSGPGDERIRELLLDDSLPWSEQPQVGRDWSGACGQLKRYFACDENHPPRFRMAPDPVAVFAAGTADVFEDSNGNVRLCKKSSMGRGTIDPLVAMALAICGKTQSEENTMFKKGPIPMIF